MEIDTPNGGLTQEEANLYDRQIRLWGVHAQHRVRNADVLLINLGALNAEVCKNIVLAGVKSVTILDSKTVTEADLSAHIFLGNESIGNNRGVSSVPWIQQLNPLVRIDAINGHIKDKNESFFAQFNVICASHCSLDELYLLNSYTRKHSILFFAAQVFGNFAYFFSDLFQYKYTVKSTEGEKSQDIKTVEHLLEFPSFEVALTTPWKQVQRQPILYVGIQLLLQFEKLHGRLPLPNDVNDVNRILAILEGKIKEQHVTDAKFIEKLTSFARVAAQNAIAEISPVCAIAGGVLGQEIIKVISATEEPFRNFFFYNGLDLVQPAMVAYFHGRET